MMPTRSRVAGEKLYSIQSQAYPKLWRLLFHGSLHGTVDLYLFHLHLRGIYSVHEQTTITSRFVV